VATPTPGDSAESIDVLSAPARARQRAREHAADVRAAARERRYLLSALACGVPVEDLAADLRISPRAIRHLLGPHC
jgi:hypothetical protein